jgi:hypothetical protein
MKLRATLVIAYEVDPKDYGTNNIVKMASIDEYGFAENLDILFDMIYNKGCELIVDSPWYGYIKEKGTRIN